MIHDIVHNATERNRCETLTRWCVYLHKYHVMSKSDAMCCSVVLRVYAHITS